MPLHPFQTRIQENRDGGMSRVDSVRQAMADDPHGYHEWLASETRKFDISTAPARLSRRRVGV